jgi:tagatose-1,6-bisphosphate aldolase
MPGEKVIRMTALSIGKFRGIQACTTSQGSFTCLALDHRQNLRRALNPSDPALTTDAELSQFKMDVVGALADRATAVLLDPEVSAAQAVGRGILPGRVPFVVAVESTGYGGAPNARQSQVLPGWSLEKAKRMGASMVKLLVYYHPDSSTAPEIEAFVKQIGEESLRLDLGVMLEPLSYSLDPDKKLSSSEKRYVVTETARRLMFPGMDVLKAEFPLDIEADPDEQTWAQACAEISSACRAPWILLSAAVNYSTYLRQVTVACNAGASGIAVGRAVWQEAVQLKGVERLNFLQTTARDRLTRLTALCSALARPVTDFYPYRDIPFDWYRNY